MMEENELEAIEKEIESNILTPLQYIGIINNLIAALRAEQKATEKLAEELGSSECPCLWFLWEPKDAPEWCEHKHRPSSESSTARLDCYDEGEKCWIKWDG